MKVRELFEAVDVNGLSSGFTKGKKQLSAVADVLSGEENILVGKTEYKVAKKGIPGTSLAKGMIVLASYNSYNQGAQVYEILGVTDDDKKYGEGGVKFDSVKDVLKAKGVSSLKALEDKQGENEYGMHSYLVVKDLSDGDEGPWFYLSSGRWCRGSGAERLSFALLEKVSTVKEAKSTRVMKDWAKEMQTVVATVSKDIAKEMDSDFGEGVITTKAKGKAIIAAFKKSGYTPFDQLDDYWVIPTKDDDSIGITVDFRKEMNDLSSDCTITFFNDKD